MIHNLKKLILPILFLLCLTSALAQEIEFEIEEEQSKDFEAETNLVAQGHTTPFFEFFNKNISGYLVASRVESNTGRRANYSLQLQYTQEFGDLGKITLSANAFANELFLKAKLREEVRNEPDYNPIDSPDERTILFKSSGSNLQETYFDLNLGDFLQLSAGNKLIVFGQFDIVSPIDILSLPNKISSSGLTFNKLDSRLSQQVIQFNIYPTANVEIQLFQFPKIFVDPLLEDSVFDGRATYQTCPKNQACTHNLLLDVSIDHMPLSSEAEKQQAARILFYPEWGTIGLSYHSGYGNFGFVFANKIYNLNDNNTEATRDDYIVESTKFLRRRIYGFEIAIPSGNWNWKMEIASNLNANGAFSLVTDDLYSSSGELRSPGGKELAEFLEWIREQNHNSLNYDYTILFAALGVDADLNLWKLNLVTFVLHNMYSPKVQKGIDLYAAFAKKSPRVSEQSVPSTVVAPAFNIARYWNENKVTATGFIVGIIPGGTGLSIYFNKEYFEALTILAAFEAISYSEDQHISLDSDYKLASLSTGLRLGFGYQF